MDTDTIRRLANRGQCAAEDLRQRFGGTGPGWDEHRWLRYRRTMASLEAYLNRYEVGYGYAHGGATPYPTLIARGETLPPEGYPWRDVPHRTFAQQETAQLVGMAQSWNGAVQSFRDGAPEPENPLRQVPKQ